MSFKHVAIIAVIATATVAAVTAFAGANPTAAPATPAPAASQVDASACPQAPWPFGCQWREPTRRVVARNPRNF